MGKKEVKKMSIMAKKCRISLALYDENGVEQIMLDTSMDSNYCYTIMTKEEFQQLMHHMVEFYNAMQMKDQKPIENNDFNNIYLN